MKIILCAGITVRSGTNYMGSIFSEIPNVSSLPPENTLGEFPFFRDKIINNYDNWFEDFNKNMCYNEGLKKRSFDKYFGESFLNYLKVEFEISEKILFVKDPSLYNIENFYNYFPDGKLIILLRNAPDLLASSLKGSLLTRNSYGKFKRLKARIKFHSGYNMLSYSKAYKRHTVQLEKVRGVLKNRFLEIKYEDLVENPDIKIPEILDYCNIDYNDKVIEKAKKAKVVGSSFFGARNNTQDWGKLEKNNDFNPIGRYKTWNWIHRWIYNKYADKANKLVGYHHKV